MQTAADEQPIYETISTAYRSFLTLIIMTGSFIAILDTTVVDVVIPKMMGPLATDLYGIQWVITAYMTAAAVALLLTHNLSHVIGLKKLFITGIIVFTGASAMCGMAASLETMILFRAVQGVGEAFIMASAQTILFSIYPPDKKGLAMGIYAMGVSFAPSLGPTVGGWITEHMSWRWVFYINLPVGILNMVAAAFFIPVLVRHKVKLRFNFISYFFMGAFTLFLLILLSKGQQYGWFQSTTIGLMAFGAAIAFLAFLLSEILSEHKLIDPAIFKNRIYTLSLGFYFFILGLSIYQLFFLLPLYYENLKLLGTFDTGIHMLAFAIFIAIFSPLAGILSDRYGPQRVLTFSCILYLFTSWYLIPSLNYYTPSVRAAIITIPLGIGLGALFAPLSAMALGNLGDKTAQGVSLMHYLRFVGGSLGTAIATNTLEKNFAVHFEGIGISQNYQYVRHFTDQTAMALSRLFPVKLALAKAHVFTAKIQAVQALSFAFQDTFRNTFFFAVIGTLFFVGIVIVKRGETGKAKG
ncbi:MAG: DHA2 family efflux MFS transporter permease subunit [Deltaproteobacteria bacterium]|nr:DHA2 family efflux MFS transporter permease subunit [Deltaproteobacteria bacterium]